MKRKLAIAVALVTITGLSAAAMYIRRDDDTPKVATGTASRGSILTVISATGTLEAVDTVLVGTQVSGVIQSLGADFNSIVKKGQVLARLDPSIIQAEIQRAQANLLGAEADVDRLNVLLDDAETKLNRAKALAVRQLISASDLDAAELARRTNEAQVKAATAQVRQSRAALAQTQINLQKTVIVSPIDGIVISRSVDVGQTVAASLQAPTLYTIAADLSQMQLKASIDESDLGNIKDGQVVTFHVDAYPNDVFHGTVRAGPAEPRDRIERGDVRGHHLGAERGVETQAGHDGHDHRRSRAPRQRPESAERRAPIQTDEQCARRARATARRRRTLVYRWSSGGHGGQDRDAVRPADGLDLRGRPPAIGAGHGRRDRRVVHRDSRRRCSGGHDACHRCCVDRSAGSKDGRDSIIVQQPADGAAGATAVV